METLGSPGSLPLEVPTDLQMAQCEDQSPQLIPQEGLSAHRARRLVPATRVQTPHRVAVMVA